MARIDSESRELSKLIFGKFLLGKLLIWLWPIGIVLLPYLGNRFFSNDVYFEKRLENNFLQDIPFSYESNSFRIINNSRREKSDISFSIDVFSDIVQVLTKGERTLYVRDKKVDRQKLQQLSTLNKLIILKKEDPNLIKLSAVLNEITQASPLTMETLDKMDSNALGDLTKLGTIDVTLPFVCFHSWQDNVTITPTYIVNVKQRNTITVKLPQLCDGGYFDVVVCWHNLVSEYEKVTLSVGGKSQPAKENRRLVYQWNLIPYLTCILFAIILIASYFRYAQFEEDVLKEWEERETKIDQDRTSQTTDEMDKIIPTETKPLASEEQQEKPS